MVKASRKTKTIVARPPKYRDQLLKPVVDSDNCKDDEIFQPGLFEHYVVRPEELEKICICDFASYFEFSSFKKNTKSQTEDDNIDDPNWDGNEEEQKELLDWIPPLTQFKLMDSSGYIKKRRFRCVLKYRRNEKDVLENAVSTLLLFKPFRNENLEIHNADLHRIMEENKEEIERNQERYEQNATLFENIDELEKIFKDDDGDHILDQNDEEVEMEIVEEVKDFEAKYEERDNTTSKDKESDKISYEELKEQVRSLNKDQRSLFDDMVERYSIPLGVLEPLLLHIQGAAGTGKSFLLKALINGVRYITEKRKISISPEQPTVVVGAPTNNSAFNIGGKTIHSLLGFGFTDEETNAYSGINGQNAKDLPFKFENTRLMVLDEVSMIGSNMFSKISLRLQEILSLWPSWKFRSFGGLDLLLLGDFFQLPPILDRYIFQNSTLRGRCGALSKNHYEDNVSSFLLTEKMRSREDSTFGDLCDAIACEQLTRSDLELLNSRSDIPCPFEQDHDNFKSGNLMVLCLENTTIQEINIEYLHKLNKHQTLYEFQAKDSFAHLSEPVGEVNLNYTDCGNLASTLSIKVDSPVMLTKNISKADGLLNGKRGYVVDVDEKNSIIWVEFFENIGNIARMKEKLRPKKSSQRAVPIYLWKNSVSFYLNGKRKKGPLIHRRNQFPLVLAYATTVHKAQGLTLNSVIVDFERNSKRAVPAGAFYTAVSRVRSLDKLFLRNFKKTDIRTDVRVKEEVEKLKKKPYVFLKRFLYQQCFQNIISETKISYLNINGFATHEKDISTDINLLESDVIMLAETKSKSDCVGFKIPGFRCLAVLKPLNAGSGGMAVLCKEERIQEVEVIEKKHQGYDLGYIEYMQIMFNKKTFTGLYLHPTVATRRRDWLKEQIDILKESCVIMGDLNLRSEDPDDLKKLENLFPKFKLFIQGPTFQRSNHFSSIDHVFVSKTNTDPFYCTAFKNIYSDHSTISFR